MINRTQTGFTMIEIVIVIGVSIVLMLGLLNLFDWHQKVYLKEQATVRTTDSVRGALMSLSENIAQSVGIQSSHVFSGTTYSTGGSSLVLKLPTINSSDAIVASTYDYFAYYLSNGSVYITADLGAGSARQAGTKLLAEKVQSFSLTYNNGDPTLASSVTIDIQASITERTGTYTTHTIDTIFLRNQ